MLPFVRTALAVISVPSTFLAGRGGSAKPTAGTGCKGALIASAPGTYSISQSETVVSGG